MGDRSADDSTGFIHPKPIRANPSSQPVDMGALQEYAFGVHKIPVGVLGASGYAGRELCALIGGHPAFELAFATANERRGETVRVNGPAGAHSVTFVPTDDAPLGDAAIVFSALPHGASATWVARALAAGAKVVDLSADLRPGNGGEAGAPYGLPELFRSSIPGASVVANPGCYPTATLVALAPLLARGLVAPGALIDVVAASGVTGAGFTARHDLLFGEITENYRAYGVGNTHRHLNEMRAVVGGYGVDADLLFTPHLLPVARGILATITVPLTEALTDPLSLWRDFYAGEPFIEISDTQPTLREVVLRNVVRLTAVPVANVRRPMIQLFAAIDNLTKGAAGQAVQNANILLGLEETMGLPA
jgi:N-acetyl-gamma-glutamyl-phosphate reductase